VSPRRVALAFTALCGLWLSLSRCVVPRLIDAAYHGRAPAFLNRVIKGQRVHALDHYLGVWQRVSLDLLIVLVLTGMVSVLLASQRVRQRILGPSFWQTGRRADLFVVLASLVVGCSLTLAVATGVRHDYESYLVHWGLILRGETPWGTNVKNAYGPLYNALALLTLPSRLGPKMVFTMTWLGCALLVARVAARQPGASERPVRHTAGNGVRDCRLFSATGPRRPGRGLRGGRRASEVLPAGHPSLHHA